MRSALVIEGSPGIADGAHAKAGANLWLCGRDGQFVIAGDWLWVAREGDLPAGAVALAPRKVPLNEIALFTVVDTQRPGEHCVRPVLVGEDWGVEPTPLQSESVVMNRREFALLLEWAVCEGVSVVDPSRGQRVPRPRAPGGTLHDQPHAQVDRSVAPVRRRSGEDSRRKESGPSPEVRHVPVVAESPARQEMSSAQNHAELFLEAPQPEQAAEVVERVVVPETVPLTMHEPAVPHRELPTEISMRVEQRGIEVTEPEERDTSDESEGGQSSAEEIDEYAAQLPVWAQAGAPEVTRLMGETLDGLNGAATAAELLKSLGTNKSITDPRQRNAMREAMESRWELRTVSWHLIGSVWVCVGGSDDTDEVWCRNGRLVKCLESLCRSASQNTTVEAEAETTVQEILGPQRYRSLMKRLRPAPATKKGPSPVQRVTQRVAEVKEKILPSEPRTSGGVSDSSVDKPTGVLMKRRAVKALFAGQARVYYDVAGFRTVALVDVVDGSVTVTAGDLIGRVFSDPTTAINAVRDRHDPGDTPLTDGLDHWMLDDQSGLTLQQALQEVTGR